MRNYIRNKNIATILICLLYCFFVIGHEIYSRNTAETLIKQHARVIADALWNVNMEGTAEYLRLATMANNYSRLTVYETSHDVFQTFSNESTSQLDAFFKAIRLTPLIRLSSQVSHHGKTIGSIEAIWQPPTIYIDIYVLVVLIMVTATLHMQLRSIFDKSILEERIEARTKELAQSNRILLREIHQKKKATAILRKSEEQYRQLYRESRSAEEVYRSLIDSSADAILICNMNRQVEYLSATFTTFFGWKLEEVKGKELALFASADADNGENIFTDILESGRPCHAQEIQGITRDGTIIDISISGSRYNDHQGRPTGILFVIRDISSRKRMEKQLQRAERLEAIGTLAGGIAHDFNNLLMGIQGNASLARLELAPDAPCSEKIQAIESYVKNGQELTGQLLGFARGGKYQVVSTDLNQLIHNETSLYSRTRKDILFKEDYQKDIMAVEVDRGQFRQVLLNLYVNAGQAMPDGGNIHVTTRNATLDVTYSGIYKIPPGKYVQIFVTDSGHGMTRQTQARIFDPFFTTKEIGRGTGLGLASAYGIIKNHNGFIDVNSEPGQGTTFTIYLPASDKAIQKEQKSLEAEEFTQGQGTILLVDDEAMILDVAKEMLKALGYTVITASSGKEATQLYLQDHQQCIAVILDMIMPDLDGGAVFDQLKAINPEIKVILSSGYSLNEKAAEIMAKGCAGFLQKPFNISQLSTKIQEILASSEK